MAPYDTSDNCSRKDEVPRDREPVSRITLIEVLVAVAIIVALILWLPSEWNK